MCVCVYIFILCLDSITQALLILTLTVVCGLHPVGIVQRSVRASESPTVLRENA